MIYHNFVATMCKPPYLTSYNIRALTAMSTEYKCIIKRKNAFEVVFFFFFFLSKPFERHVQPPREAKYCLNIHLSLLTDRTTRLWRNCADTQTPVPSLNIPAYSWFVFCMVLLSSLFWLLGCSVGFTHTQCTTLSLWSHTETWKVITF